MADTSTSKFPQKVPQSPELGMGTQMNPRHEAVDDSDYERTVGNIGNTNPRARSSNTSSSQSKTSWAPLWIALAIVIAGILAYNTVFHSSGSAVNTGQTNTTISPPPATPSTDSTTPAAPPSGAANVPPAPAITP